MTLALEALKPFLWLALAAFLVGFVSYLALGRPSPAIAQDEMVQAPASAPVSDEWNLPKRI
jgi:hypothetical protein